MTPVYSLPVLNGMLQSCNVKHLRLLVSTVFLLLKEKITFQYINTPDDILFESVARFQFLYGQPYMTFIVDLLTDFAKSMKLWGPLRAL